MATVLYARVSTTEQTIEHQRTQAEKAGFQLDTVVWDEGVSGVSHLNQRVLVNQHRAVGRSTRNTQQLPAGRLQQATHADDPASQDARAEADHVTLTVLHTINVRELTILEQQQKILEMLQQKTA